MVYFQTSSSWVENQIQIFKFNSCFKLGEKGKFAIVKRARHLLTGEDVAIKVIDKDKIDEISRLHIHKEVILLRAQITTIGFDLQSIWFVSGQHWTILFPNFLVVSKKGVCCRKIYNQIMWDPTFFTRRTQYHKMHKIHIYIC